MIAGNTLASQNSFYNKYRCWGEHMEIPMHYINSYLKKFAAISLGVMLLWSAYYVSSKNYLLFHTFAEMFTIVISFTITLIVFHNYKNLKNDFIPIIGIAYAFTGIFDIVHMLAYKGVGVFHNVGSNLATQMWIIARYLDSIGMLIAGISFSKTVKPPFVLITYVVISLTALLAVFYWQVFPVCFIEEQGLTHFKIYSEYIISVLLVGSVLLLMYHKNQFHPKVYMLLLVFFLTSIGTELTFTLYEHVYGLENLIGHLFKLTAFFFLYRAIVETSLKEPFNLLFFQLNQANELLKANEVKLVATNQELKSFANIVAHDFRAPLVNLNGFSQELEYAFKDLRQIINGSIVPSKNHPQELNMLLEKDIPEALSFIHSSVNKMERMITALLKLSRLGRRELHYEEINMNELVRVILQAYNHQIAQNDIQVEVGSLPQIRNDYLAMEQIMSNLLDNALKYLEPGRRGEISIYCEETEHEVTFYIRDNGRGIAEKDQEKIFEIFQRVGNLHVPGEGMGLAYVKNLIRQMGGQVSCESDLGVGTKISFTVS